MSATLSRHSDNKWIVLGILALAQFMVVLDVAIVNVALPSIEKELHFQPNNLQWVVTAYTLTFGGFLLLGGRASDLFGRRKIFLSAVTAFFIASFLCGLAETESQLIIARAVQGLAAAIMSPAALSIVLSEFREGKERDRALGVWAAVAAGGAAAGVLLGGILTQYLGWRWNFFINVGVGIGVVTAGLRLIPRYIGEEKSQTKLDLPGAALVTSGLMSLVYGLSKAPNDGWGSGTVLGFIALAFILLAAFFWNERHAPQPLMPLRIFKIRNVLGGNLAFLAIACTLFSMFFFLTLYVQTVLDYSPVKTGISFLPATIIIAATSGIVSNIVGRFGYKPFMIAGPFVLAIALFTLSNTIEVGGTYWQNVFPGLALFAFGMGLSFISVTLAATSGIPKHFSGLASGLLTTSQQVGGAIGLAVLSAIAFTTIRTQATSGVMPLQAQVHGYQDALRVGAGLALLAMVIVVVVVKNRKVDAREAAVT